MTSSIKRRWFRILSFDGGPMAGPSLLYLQKIVQDCPDFFTKAEVFTGTSDGSYTALYLASRTDEELEDGPKIIEDIIELHRAMYIRAQIPNPLYEVSKWVSDPSISGLKSLVKELPGSMFKQAWRYSAFFSGFSTLMDSRPVEEYMREMFRVRSGPKKGQDMRLGDLPQKVLVVAFDLTKGIFTQPIVSRHGKEEEAEVSVTWGPRMYNNLTAGLIPPEIANMSVYDLAIRSSSLPLFFPMKEGCVDGSVFANNPSMGALSVVLENLMNDNLNNLEDLSSSVEESEPIITGREDVLQFSMGGGDRYFVNQENSSRTAKKLQDSSDGKGDSLLWWGYWKWLLSPADPLRAVKLLFNAGDNGISFQCENLMGRGNYYRMILSTPHDSVYDMFTLLLGSSDKLFTQGEKGAKEWHRQSSWKESIRQLLKASNLFNPPSNLQDQPDNEDKDENEDKHLYYSIEVPELPRPISHVLSEDFSPSMVDFPRAIFRKELNSVRPKLTEEQMEERLDILSGYIYVCSSIADYIESVEPRLIALHKKVDAKLMASLLLRKVYKSLSPKDMNVFEFVDNTGKFAMEFWRQLNTSYQQNALDSSFGTSVLWIQFIWMLEDTRSLETTSLQPLWHLLSQRTPYGGTDPSAPAFLDLFSKSSEYYRDFVKDIKEGKNFF